MRRLPLRQKLELWRLWRRLRRKLEPPRRSDADAGWKPDQEWEDGA